MVGNGKLKTWRFLSNKKSTKSENTKPLDAFICPISGLLMFDPVIVSSGQTFERTSVQLCQGLNFVPVFPDGSKPDFSTVIPNLALKKAIVSWCASTGADLPRAAPDYSLIEDSVRKLIFRDSERDLIKGMADKPLVILTHAVTQLNRQSINQHHFYSSSSEESVIANVLDTPPLPLVTRPSCFSSSPSASTSSEIVVDETLETLAPNSIISDEQNLLLKLQSLEEQQQSVILMRKLTRTDEKARVSLCTPKLLASLRECVVSRNAVVQTNAVAALVNLSLEKTNKLKIVRSGIVPPLIDVLKSGFAESRDHAAGALFSLALEEENKTAIGVLGALQPLLHALHSDSERTRHDSALALYHLSLVQSNRIKLVKLGAVSTLLTMLETSLAGRVLLVLCNLASSNEGKSVMLDSNAVECLFRKLRTENVDSAESTRENCVACLYSLSVGSMRFKGLARAARAAEVLHEVVEIGSDRAREKAKRMLIMLRERDDGEEGRGLGGFVGSRGESTSWLAHIVIKAFGEVNSNCVIGVSRCLAGSDELEMLLGQERNTGLMGQVLSADSKCIENAIRCGGLAPTKASCIKNMLSCLLEKRGRLCLEYLRDLSVDQIKTELSQFKGIGPKTVACVLMFNLQQDDFPVDTHIFQIAKAIGWVPVEADTKRTYLHLNKRIPNELKFDLNCLLFTHGKACRKCIKKEDSQQKKETGSCPLLNYLRKV